MTVWGRIVTCLENGGACALVTVADTGGSTPREAGARMVVRPDAGFYGTIGGGTLEFEAIRRAASAAQEGQARFEMMPVSLGPDLGQCCGGRAQLAIEVFTQDHLDQAREFAERERAGAVFTTTTIVTDGRTALRALSEQDRTERIALSQEGGRTHLLETFGDIRRPLYLFGAGHVGKALVLALAPLPFSIVWIDSRADQFPSAVPANVSKVTSTHPWQILQEAPADAFVLAMTHSHALDEEIMAQALLCQKFSYCGVIGSQTKRARFRKRLKSRGLDDALIAGMVCPIGVTAVQSKHPAAIAAGIAVDLLQRDEAQKLYGKAGMRLAQK